MEVQKKARLVGLLRESLDAETKLERACFIQDTSSGSIHVEGQGGEVSLVAHIDENDNAVRDLSTADICTAVAGK